MSFRFYRVLGDDARTEAFEVYSVREESRALRLGGWLVGFTVSAVLVTVAASDGVGRLPARLADYRSWATTTEEPQLLPYELSVQCAPDYQAHKSGKSDDPHASRWVRVYANASAAAAMRERELASFPVGSIIAKEKLLQPTDSRPEGVAFMIKHGKGKFKKSGGWEFLYYPAGEKAGALEGCVTCHRVGATRDYVFGTFERE